MPRDASGTKERIIEAAEAEFARHGVDGAQLRDIVRAAGQANDSAIHYHFGSRRGLLAEISERHIASMEPARHAMIDRLRDAGGLDDLTAVVTALVVPTAALLKTQRGRYFLGITAQLAGRAGIRTGTVPPPLAGTALRGQLELVQDLCRKELPERLARERIAVVIGMLTAALADRANLLDRGARPLLGHAAFAANLVTMMVAALRAPLPDGVSAPARPR